jgi:hypothetical protein
MKEILENLHLLKVGISAAGVIVALLIDSKLGPAEDDLPLRFKVILAVPVIAAVFQVQHLTGDQRAAALPYLFALFVAALVAYSMIWSLLGYTKEVATPRQWWKFWGDNYSYSKVRVMGGCLVPGARNTIQRENITPQEYFEGTAYNQDRVWTRKSRACAQVLLILTYIAVVLFYIAIMTVTLT